MLVSGREAIRILASVVSGDAQARQVLRSGLAGLPTATPRGPMYDAEQVTALVARPVVAVDDLPELCPAGLYIARIPRSTEVDAGADWRTRAAALGERPAMTPMKTALLGVGIALSGGLPWVATLSGWVVLTANATGLRGEVDGRHRFTLGAPGAWAEAFDGHRLPTPRGGRPWYLWTPERL